MHPEAHPADKFDLVLAPEPGRPWLCDRDHDLPRGPCFVRCMDGVAVVSGLFWSLVSSHRLRQ